MGWYGWPRSARSAEIELGLYAVLIRVLPDLDQAGGLQSLDGVAAAFVLPDVVPARRVFQCVLKYRQHVLAEADSPALVVNRGHRGAAVALLNATFGVSMLNSPI
jgi:hypothetical protein